MVYKNIQSEFGEGIATITLNRPPLNVLNIEMMEEINSCLDAFREEKSLRLLVFRASGKAFSAGVDVGEHLGDKVNKMIEVFHGMFIRIDELKVPSLAVVNGAALGGGCELAIYCDIVLASDKARFGQPEIQVGVFPPIAALVMPRIMGRKKAMELILLGETISAAEALSVGLVNKVVPEEALASEAKSFIDKFKNLSAPVLKLTRQAVIEGLCDDIGRGLKLIEDIYLNRLMKTHDATEGLKAFLEKRKPCWRDE